MQKVATVVLAIVLGLAAFGSVAHAVDENTFSGSVDELRSACAELGGAFFETSDATYGICLVEGGLSLGCDDIVIEGEDNCWLMQERKIPKGKRSVINGLVEAGGGDLSPPKKVPKRVVELVDALQIVTKPGFAVADLPRRSQAVLDVLATVLAPLLEQPAPGGGGGGGPRTATTRPGTPPTTTGDTSTTSSTSTSTTTTTTSRGPSIL